MGGRIVKTKAYCSETLISGFWLSQYWAGGLCPYNSVRHFYSNSGGKTVAIKNFKFFLKKGLFHTMCTFFTILSKPKTNIQKLMAI